MRRSGRLAEDFPCVGERVGLSCCELPRLRRAREAARYTDSYDGAIRRIVGERFRRDIETFGYEFGAD